MNIYPAIDIKDGKCVRLKQGVAKDKTVYFEDPLDAAKMFADNGAKWLHLVDLDGAFAGTLCTLGILSKIAALGVKVQIGGGMRTKESVKKALDAGASRAIVGTRACSEPSFASELVSLFGDKIAVGIDAKSGKVAIKGWVEVSKVAALDLAADVAKRGVKTIIYTDIDTDGMLTGANIPAQEAMLKTLEPYGANLIASGGVSNMKDIKKLSELGLKYKNFDGAIIGKALYEKKIDLKELLKGE